MYLIKETVVILFDGNVSCGAVDRVQHSVNAYIKHSCVFSVLLRK